MNGRSLVLGQYYPVTSVFHAVDPRVKIALVVLYTSSMFLISDISVLLLSGLIIPALAIVSRLPLTWLLRGLKPLVFILFFTFIMHLLFTPGEQLVKIGPLGITETGLRRGSFYTLRLILIVAASSFITLTTTPIKLTDAIEALLSPLKKLRFPAHEFALMVTIALRFIPTLLAEAETIMKAQKARGADFESGHVIRRAKNLLPLLVPLFVSAFRRADELALAMEARGYRGGEGRTRLHVLSIRMADLLWLGGGLSLIIFLVGLSWII